MPGRKEKAGFSGSRPGKEAAALDAADAAPGTFGPAAFALVTSLIVESSAALALVLATVVWLAVSVLWPAILIPRWSAPAYGLDQHPGIARDLAGLALGPIIQSG